MLTAAELLKKFLVFQATPLSITVFTRTFLLLNTESCVYSVQIYVHMNQLTKRGASIMPSLWEEESRQMAVS